MKNDRGQVIIILLLVMVVGLTIGLSVVSRSLLNVKQSTQTEESSRAFTAAEAGIEVALEGTVTGETTPIGDSSYKCTKDEQGSGPENVFYNLEKDKVAQLYFTSAVDVETRLLGPAVNSVRLLWGVPGSNIDLSAPALEVNLIYKNITDSSYHLAKFALDPNSTRANSNRFCFPDSTCDKVSNFDTNGTEEISTPDGVVRFHFGADLDVSSFNTDPNLLIFGRFRFLYNPTPSHLGIKVLTPPNANLPSQGSVIDCLGTVAQTGVSRRIKVFENHPAVPEVFDYVLFNGNPSQSLGH